MTQKKYMIFGAAFGLASRNRACVLGPRRMQAAGLLRRLQALNITIEDGGIIEEPTLSSQQGSDKLRHLDDVLAFSAKFVPKLESAWRAGYHPVVVGGDHSISISTISVAAAENKRRFGPDAELGLIWVDAHADINTPETTPSGNIHGMPLAVLLGYGAKELCSIGGPGPKIKPENLVYMGLRDVDPPEREFLRKLPCHAYSMKEIDLWGIGEICRRAFAAASANTTAFVVSFDLDSCDPHLAPAVGTPVRGGLSFRESHLIMELAAEQEKFAGVEVVELIPALDAEGATCELAIGLLESALGKTIL